MIATMKQEKKIIHPLKFVMYAGCASIVNDLCGLKQCLYRKAKPGKLDYFDVPVIFYYSTAVIILSSVALILSRKAFINRQMKQYKTWLFFTLVLGLSFVFFQYYGFKQLWASGFTVTRNVSFSFLYVIVGTHALHVLGGVIALLVMYLKSYSKKRKNYNQIYIDLMNTYWHFVDILWVYLLVFLMFMG